MRTLQKLHKDFKLNDIVAMINDENKDSVIDGIESLIKRNIIIPVFHVQKSILEQIRETSF